MYPVNDLKAEDMAYLAYVPLTNGATPFTINYYPVPYGAFVSGMHTDYPSSIKPTTITVNANHMKLLPAEAVHTVKASIAVQYLVLLIMINPTKKQKIKDFNLVFDSDVPDKTFEDLIKGK